jgi:hypothetical protein
MASDTRFVPSRAQQAGHRGDKFVGLRRSPPALGGHPLASMLQRDQQTTAPAHFAIVDLQFGRTVLANGGKQSWALLLLKRKKPKRN